MGGDPDLPPGLGAGRGVTLYNTGVADLHILGGSFVVHAAGGAPSLHHRLADPTAVTVPQAD